MSNENSLILHNEKKRSTIHNRVKIQTSYPNGRNKQWWRHYDVKMASFWRHHDVFTSCVRWDITIFHLNILGSSSWIFYVSDHYYDVIMGAMASQITSLTIVYSTVYSSADLRKHQSSAPLAFMRGIHQGPVNSPHKGSVTRKIFPFDDVIMHTEDVNLRSDSNHAK